MGGVDRMGSWPSCSFIHGTDKIERGLMVLFFGLVFFVAHLHTSPLEMFMPTPLDLGTHLFVKVPRSGDSEVAISVFELSCHLLLPV